MKRLSTKSFGQGCPPRELQGSCYHFQSDRGLPRWSPISECQTKSQSDVACRTTTLTDCCKEGCAYAQ
jgi:hypothetical protein